MSSLLLVCYIWRLCTLCETLQLQATAQQKCRRTPQKPFSEADENRQTIIIKICCLFLRFTTRSQSSSGAVGVTLVCIWARTELRLPLCPNSLCFYSPWGLPGASWDSCVYLFLFDQVWDFCPEQGQNKRLWTVQWHYQPWYLWRLPAGVRERCFSRASVWLTDLGWTLRKDSCQSPAGAERLETKSPRLLRVFKFFQASFKYLKY